MGYGAKSDFSKGKNASPGPGAYDQNKSVSSKRDFPKYSMGKSTRSHSLSKSIIKNPGPGEYNILQGFSGNSKYSFGLKYNDLNRTSPMGGTPGPGAYSPEKLHKKDYKFTFGIKSEKVLPKSNKMPGPGNYETKSDFENSLGNAFGKDKKLSNFMSKTIVMNPGPGAYGDLETASKRFKNSQNIKFGNSTRMHERKLSSGNPGPGSYSIKGDIGNSAPKFSLSSRPNDQITHVKRMSPGPGNYSPVSSFTKKSPPGIKFGKSQRISVDNKLGK